MKSVFFEGSQKMFGSVSKVFVDPEIELMVLEYLDEIAVCKFRLVNKYTNSLITGSENFRDMLYFLKGGVKSATEMENWRYTGFGCFIVRNQIEAQAVLNSDLIQGNIFVDPPCGFSFDTEPGAFFGTVSDDEKDFEGYPLSTLERNPVSLVNGPCGILSTLISGYQGNSLIKVFRYRKSLIHDAYVSTTCIGNTPADLGENYYYGPLIKSIQNEFGVQFRVCDFRSLALCIACVVMHRYKCVDATIFPGHFSALTSLIKERVKQEYKAITYTELDVDEKSNWAVALDFTPVGRNNPGLLISPNKFIRRVSRSSASKWDSAVNVEFIKGRSINFAVGEHFEKEVQIHGKENCLGTLGELLDKMDELLDVEECAGPRKAKKKRQRKRAKMHKAVPMCELDLDKIREATKPYLEQRNVRRATYTVAVLKLTARSFGLKTGGNKMALSKRILEYVEAQKGGK